MTIWQLYHSFFHYIWTLSFQALFFVWFFFSQDLFNLIILISNLVLLINSHHCFRQQQKKKNAANSSKNRQKPRRPTENTVRFQQWGKCRRRREVGGVHLGIPQPQNIFTTERTRVLVVEVGVRFICIDPQDSDREQLEIEGVEHEVWAYYIRSCL